MTNVERTTNGTKDAPKKRDWRDLADRVLDENPEMSIGDLAEEFSEEIRKRDGYRYSLAYEMMERQKHLRERPAKRRVHPARERIKAELADKAADLTIAKYTTLLNTITIAGKRYGETKGPEFIKLGGWHVALGKRLGSASLNERVTRPEIRKLLDKHVASETERN